MSYAQIDEKVLFSDFETIRNVDFNKVTDSDYDNWDIEYKSDYYYRPNVASPITFLDYPVLEASFYLTENRKVRKVSLSVFLKDADIFYGEMVKNYGLYSTASISEFYMNQYGFRKPGAYKEFDENIYSSMPNPSPLDYKNVKSITWNNVGQDSNGNVIVIQIYNYPEDGYDFFHSSRKLRIIISSENNIRE